MLGPGHTPDVDCCTCLLCTCSRQDWLTGVAFSPYDQALYVAAYGTKDEPPAVLRFSAGALRCVAEQDHTPVALPDQREHLELSRLTILGPLQLYLSCTHHPAVCRPSGCLVSGAAIKNPEGLAFAKQTCYVASAGHAAVVAVSAGDGAILQTLELADDAVPWGMAAWDPSTYPLHAAAAARQAAGQPPSQAQQSAQQQPQHSPSGAGSSRPVPAGSQPPASAAAAAQAQAAQGCLLVAVQADVEKDNYYHPPKGPASGALVCVPLISDGHMLPWQEWSRVKIKRPSGVTIDHAGVNISLQTQTQHACV